VLVPVGFISECGVLVLEMFGLNCFRVRTKSLLIAVLKYRIKGAQLVACLLIYVSHAYFYVIRSSKYIFHSVFTFISVFCDVASKSSSVVLFLNTTLTFPMVVIKQNIQIILCPSIDECLFCRL
jgi:hypothetical protein